MPFRFAVLWSLEGPTSMPVGIAVDMLDHVHVDVPEHYCIAAKHRGEYRIVQPDGTPMVVRPQDDPYFEQVLADLARTFAIGDRGELDAVDKTEILSLLRTTVLDPLTTTYITGEYRPAYGEIRYLHEGDTDEEAAPSSGQIALVA